jgi:hypothetical protein
MELVQYNTSQVVRVIRNHYISKITQLVALLKLVVSLLPPIWISLLVLTNEMSCNTGSVLHYPSLLRTRLPRAFLSLQQTMAVLQRHVLRKLKYILCTCCLHSLQRPHCYSGSVTSQLAAITMDGCFMRAGISLNRLIVLLRYAMLLIISLLSHSKNSELQQSVKYTLLNYC